MSENVSLSTKQLVALQALLEGKNNQEAADACGVTDRTLQRWLLDPHFCKAFSEARTQVFNHAVTSLHLKFDKAVRTLDRHTSAEKTIPRDQIRAAEVIIDKTLQTAELTKRISELESELEKRDQDTMYKVVIDLRSLSKEDRVLLKELHDRASSRENA